eukprot:5957393-Alexandrium_andersonii.AAC.1
MRVISALRQEIWMQTETAVVSDVQRDHSAVRWCTLRSVPTVCGAIRRCARAQTSPKGIGALQC